MFKHVILQACNTKKINCLKKEGVFTKFFAGAPFFCIYCNFMPKLTGL
mgnify:CR=1 FL=1